MVAVPPSGVTRPSSARNVVVFPAPFRPRNPATVPAPTSKLSSSTASTGPNRLVSRCTSITAIVAPSRGPASWSPGHRRCQHRGPGHELVLVERGGCLPAYLQRDEAGSGDGHDCPPMSGL